MKVGLIHRRRVSLRRYAERKPHIQRQFLSSGWTLTEARRKVLKRRKRVPRRVIELR